MQVTVIPSDGFIMIDGLGLQVKFPPDLIHGLHALQWENGLGWIEFEGETPNYELTTSVDYDRKVKPFVDLFEQEKARLESCPGPFYIWDDCAGKWVFDQQTYSLEYQGEISKLRGDLEKQSIKPLIEAVLALAENRQPSEADLQSLKDFKHDLDLLENNLFPITEEA